MSNPGGKATGSAASGTRVAAVKCVVKNKCVWTATGGVYKIARVLAESIYGEVVVGLVCRKSEEDGRYYETATKVAMKIMSKVRAVSVVVLACPGLMHMPLCRHASTLRTALLCRMATRSKIRWRSCRC